MELETPGSCDLYARKASHFCCAIGHGRGGVAEPELHVTEAIASVLINCNRRSASRPCRALDLGANNGWMSAHMMQLGAHVTAVEPSPDLSRALNETADVNCWADRLTLHTARACLRADARCFHPKPCATCSCGGWRWGNTQGHAQVTVRHGEACAMRFGLPAAVGGVVYEDLLWEASAGTGELDLIKMDADGPEGAWMRSLDALLSRPADGRPRLRVRSLIVEGSRLEPAVMVRLQSVHGYTVLRLDEHDDRRLVTRTGWDAYSPDGTIAPLNRYASEHVAGDRARCKYSPPHVRPMADNVSRFDLEDEWFGVRAMRHVYRVKPNLSEQG